MKNSENILTQMGSFIEEYRKAVKCEGLLAETQQTLVNKQGEYNDKQDMIAKLERSTPNPRNAS